MFTRIFFALRNPWLLALFLAIGSYGVAPAAAHAQSLVFTDTVPLQRTDWANVMAVPRFDPTLGILTRVEMTVTGDVTGTVGVENQEANPVTVLVQEQATENIRLPNSATLSAGGVVISQSVNLSPFDNVIDFGGTSGVAFPVIATVANSRSFSAQADLAHFIGVGNLSLPATARVQWTGAGSGNMILQLRHFANATLRVRYVYVMPAIEIKKFTNGFDADNPNAPDVPPLQAGDPVTWTYRLTNTGAITIPLATVTLSGTTVITFPTVVVTDSHPGVTPTLLLSSDVNNDRLLAPGEVWTYIATGVVQDLDAPIPGTTIVPGCNPGGTTAPGERPVYENLGFVTIPGMTDSDPSHYCNPAAPAIVILKLTNGFDANNPDGPDVPQLRPGDAVTWTYIVTNTGNITFALNTVVVTDSQPGITPQFVAGSDNGDGLLSPGEQWIFRATGTVLNLDAPGAGVTVVPGCNANDTQVPGAQPTYTNLGRVTVPGATAEDPSHYCNPPTVAINLEKTVYRGHNNGASCPGVEQATDQVGLPVTYCFEITNTGETYLDTLVFTDTLLNITNISQLTYLTGTLPLAPGARIVYAFASTIPVGTRLNTAEVEANPTDDQGRDIPGLSNPSDRDTALVSPLPTGIDPRTEPNRLFVPLMRR